MLDEVLVVPDSFEAQTPCIDVILKFRCFVTTEVPSTTGGMFLVSTIVITKIRNSKSSHMYTRISIKQIYCGPPQLKRAQLSFCTLSKLPVLSNTFRDESFLSSHLFSFPFLLLNTPVSFIPKNPRSCFVHPCAGFPCSLDLALVGLPHTTVSSRQGETPSFRITFASFCLPGAPARSSLGSARVQLSISSMVSGRGRFSVSGSSNTIKPVVMDTQPKTTPGTQGIILPWKRSR